MITLQESILIAASLHHHTELASHSRLVWSRCLAVRNVIVRYGSGRKAERERGDEGKAILFLYKFFTTHSCAQVVFSTLTLHKNFLAFLLSSHTYFPTSLSNVLLQSRHWELTVTVNSRFSDTYLLWTPR